MGDVAVDEGQKLRITTPVKGNPIPEFTWTFNGKPLTGDRVHAFSDGELVSVITGLYLLDFLINFWFYVINIGFVIIVIIVQLTQPWFVSDFFSARYEIVQTMLWIKKFYFASSWIAKYKCIESFFMSKLI